MDMNTAQWNNSYELTRPGSPRLPDFHAGALQTGGNPYASGVWLDDARQQGRIATNNGQGRTGCGGSDERW